MNREQTIAHFKGIFPPLVTPFDRHGDVDLGAFRSNLTRLVDAGLPGVLVCGSTGEAPLLTWRERLRVVEAARRIVRPPQLLLVGTGLESTRETIRLSREVIRAGADALLVVTPGYYKPKMDAAAVRHHYLRVADAVRRPVIIYSIPQFTGVQIGVETIVVLSRHPNIRGLKESSGNLKFVRKILSRVRPGFRVLVGSVLILLDALRAGATGAVLGQANFAPDLCAGLYRAFVQGRIRQAKEFQRRLAPLAERISLPFGVAGVKAALDLCGYSGGAPRSPLIPLEAAERRLVAAALREAYAGLEY
jgi:4-hydroxy-2-oxoglutarate aldolase